ncbi:MAG TPA: restriction endonuclease [Clostridiales bacterium]|nr:restriction endonuclease [Clostridiales bacterium]
MSDALTELAGFIRQGLEEVEEGRARSLLEDLFGDRYHSRHFETTMVRDALGLASRGGASGEDRTAPRRTAPRAAEGVPFAGIVNPENPPSGPYGGASVVWFPTEDSGSIITFVVGTRGLSPDEGVLVRPGHRRRVAALRRLLAREGVECWTKPDPSALAVGVPEVARRRFPGFERALQRYGEFLYCVAKVPRDDRNLGRLVVQSFFDLYAYERGWQVLKGAREEFGSLLSALRAGVFPHVSPDEVYRLLLRRRFVVLQGPPGTGKTRMAEIIKREHFAGRGMTIQFHPAVTYEDFVVGLSPDTHEGSLRFEVREGYLLQAARAAAEGPFLLVIDEVNRADLGKVLGEAIYLFEPGEVGGEAGRRVLLPHATDGGRTFALPENLYVLATMNTADRSVAGMDLAVRRRFAFVTVPPDRSVVAEQGLRLATETFDRLQDVFIEHAPDEALVLLPGHSYFLASTEDELRERFRYELLPLLDEYLHEGLLGPCATELQAVRDFIQDAVGTDGRQ